MDLEVGAFLSCGDSSMLPLPAAPGYCDAVEILHKSGSAATAAAAAAAGSASRYYATRSWRSVSNTARHALLDYSDPPSTSPSSPLVGKLNSLVSSSPASHEATKAARLSSVNSSSSDNATVDEFAPREEHGDHGKKQHRQQQRVSDNRCPATISSQERWDRATRIAEATLKGEAGYTLGHSIFATEGSP